MAGCCGEHLETIATEVMHVKLNRCGPRPPPLGQKWEPAEELVPARLSSSAAWALA